MVEIGLVVLFMVLLELDTSNCITLGFLNVFDEAGAVRSMFNKQGASSVERID